MIHWKIAALAAATAALLSILVGLFGRVSAGYLFFRALVSGLVFGALVAGMEVLGRKFLPELFTGVSGEAESPEEHEPGGEVDIVVDDDEPSVFATPGNDEAFTETDEEEPAVIEPADSPEEDRGSQVFKSGEFGLSEEKGEVSDLQEVESLDAEQPSEPSRKGDLPDIEEFSGSFEGIKGNAGMVDSLNSSKAHKLQAVDSLEKENDPVTMAQAIRTILHKDQEG
ncbi:MAG: hypothetical protein JW760_13885 [Spirochaetales bacterium]|nr:hypothetical protein [Spirochaetales bacterium]